MVIRFDPSPSVKPTTRSEAHACKAAVIAKFWGGTKLDPEIILPFFFDMAQKYPGHTKYFQVLKSQNLSHRILIRMLLFMLNLNFCENKSQATHLLQDLQGHAWTAGWTGTGYLTIYLLQTQLASSSRRFDNKQLAKGFGCSAVKKSTRGCQSNF